MFTELLIVEKSALVWLSKWDSLTNRLQKYKIYRANSFVQEYIEKHKHTWLTIQQENQNIISLLPKNEIPSSEYIRNFMRNRRN